MTTTGPRLAPSDLSPTLGRSKRRPYKNQAASTIPE